MGKVITLIWLAFTIILTVLWIINAIEYGRVDSWLNRAKDAGNPNQVSEFLTNYKQALSDKHLIEGKYYSVFKYPGKYMPVYIRAVNGLIERGEALVIQTPTDTSYQMGLINLEKDLGDLESVAFSVWLANGGIIIVVLCVISWFTFYIPLIIEIG